VVIIRSCLAGRRQNFVWCEGRSAASRACTDSRRRRSKVGCALTFEAGHPGGLVSRVTPFAGHPEHRASRCWRRASGSAGVCGGFRGMPDRPSLMAGLLETGSTKMGQDRSSGMTYGQADVSVQIHRATAGRGVRVRLGEQVQTAHLFVAKHCSTQCFCLDFE